jgi:hypothetical protein
VPLLQKRGLLLFEKEAGNYELPAHPGLLLKDSYWRWPERRQAGNAIDLFTQVFGMSFHDASAVGTRGKSKNHPATTPNWDARCAKHPVRCQRGKTPLLLKTRPIPSYAYDPNVVIWARNTTAMQDKTSNRYDASLGRSTMGEKDVTSTDS